MLRHETQPSARPVVNSCCGASNEEMQENSQNIRSSASLESLLPKQAGGNHERNSAAKQDASLCKVQNTGNPPAHRDCQWSVPSPRCPRCGICSHPISSALPA